jgi:hypothetical protein
VDQQNQKARSGGPKSQGEEQGQDMRAGSNGGQGQGYGQVQPQPGVSLDVGSAGKPLPQPIWQGTLTWSGTDASGGRKEAAVYVIASTTNPRERCVGLGWATTSFLIRWLVLLCCAAVRIHGPKHYH